MLIVGFIINLFLGWANTLLLFRCGKKFFKDANVAKISAFLYVLSGSLVYQTALYSENTFLFFGLLGLYMIDGDDSTTDWPESYRIVASSMLFGLATSSRSTGTLFSI